MAKRLFYTGLSFLLAAVLVIAGSYWLYQSALQQPLQLAAEQPLVVPQGSTPGGLLRELETQGLIKGSFWVRLAWRIQQDTPQVHAGEYALVPQMTLDDLFTKWREGDLIQHRITLVEGWTFAQFRQALANNTILQHSLDGLSDAEVMQRIEREGLHPEGQFYPDTYQFTRGQTDLDLLRQANRRLEKVLEEEWAERAENLPYATPEHALVMASIIEKETGAAHERAEIAGVFVRRLQRGMLLQTDPTVIYGMGEAYQGKITRADLRRPSAYNTYVISGLPPTPIAMVGRAAIHAAVHPADGDSIYFVARGDGTHQFSRTLQEHNRAVREYQLKRRADYRSSPAPITNDKETP